MGQLEPELARTPGQRGPDPTSRNRIYQWLRRSVNRNTRCAVFPSQSHIARELDMHPRSVQDGMTKLEEAGLIGTERVHPGGFGLRVTVAGPWRRADEPGWSMDERKRMLATAWRDLAGWSVGMVTDDDDVVIFGGERTSDIRSGCSPFGGEPCTHEDICEYALPDPDAPANWGVWLAWMEKHLPGLRLGRDDMAEAWAASVDGIQHRGTPGAALMGLMCRWYEDKDVLVAPEYVPPSVTAWWEAEQQGGTDG